jgi:pimeloyl-ACP methyl ester carboxylesterase
MSRAVARWVFERAFQDRAHMEAAWQDQRTQIPFEYPRMLRESFVRPVGFELRDFAREIDVPTYLLEGGSPGARPRFPALTGALHERLGGRFRHETIPGGHYLQLDRPQEVTQRLAAFANALAPAGC